MKLEDLKIDSSRSSYGVLDIPEDGWVPTACNACYTGCHILAKEEDGIVTRLDGNPDSENGSPMGERDICNNGLGSLQILYDPNRVNYPMKRTNPEKGIGVDPQWERISWDEALDTITEKLEDIKDTPEQLMFNRTTCCDHKAHIAFFVWGDAFGTDNHGASGGGMHCGNGSHFTGGLAHGSWSIHPDYKRCDLAIYVGATKGHGAGHGSNMMSSLAADARARGMELVVVDPFMSRAAAKADEWIPILPGTDAAFGLGMANMIVHELGEYDVPYLKEKTNAPYLVKDDGYFIRDEAGEPLIWDLNQEEAKTWDDPEIKDPAIEGEYTVKGQTVRPAFVLLSEHLKKYTPERVEEITTIPKETLRRLTKKFVEKARMGSTIKIDGKEFPYRPVSLIYFSKAQSHKDSIDGCAALQLVNDLVGNSDVPGGTMGFAPYMEPNPQTGRLQQVPVPQAGGMVKPGGWVVGVNPYPPDPEPPERFDFHDLFPMAMLPTLPWSEEAFDLYEKFDLKYPPDVMINFGTNPIQTVGNSETVAKILKEMKFIVSFDIFPTETTEGFADIVLPDTCYLETLHPAPNLPFVFNYHGCEGKWSYGIRQPVVEPLYERRNMIKVMLELAKRIGILDKYNDEFNKFYGLKGKYALDPEKEYSWEEMSDRVLKFFFGEDHGLEWFSKNGVISWDKGTEEVYWRYQDNFRNPIYWEFLPSVGSKTREICEEYGVPDLVDWSWYKPVNEWHPCETHEKLDEYDMVGINYRDPVHASNMTQEIAWLDEIAEKNPWTYFVQMNRKAGEKKGIEDGDKITLENPSGTIIEGYVSLVEGVHPKVLAISNGGHWAEGQPIAKGKGTFFDDLLPIDIEHSDPRNLNQDCCTALKITKVE